MQSVHDFKPFSPETLETPYPFYDALRAQAPVFEAAPGVFFVSNYELVRQVLHDGENFSSKRGAPFLNFQGESGLGAPTELPPYVAELLKDDIPRPDTLLGNDPPSHTRFRILVSRSLAPARVARYEPVVREVVDNLINDFIGDGRAEFVSQFSMPLPLTVAAMAIGVPRSDMAQYKRWCVDSVAQLSRPLDRDELVVSVKAGVALRKYLLERVEEAQGKDEDTVIGNLVNAHLLDDEAGDGQTYRPLDRTEIVAIVQQLLVAGQETVNYLAASLLLTLIQNPAQMALVRQDSSRIKAMVEEGVRFESPIRALGRFANHDLELGGVLIPKDSRVVILYASANRDDTKFVHPDRFDLLRPDYRDHVGFGAGIHYCVGSGLARLEGRVAFEQLLTRLDNIRLDETAPADLSHVYTFIFRALSRLDIAFDARPTQPTANTG